MARASAGALLSIDAGSSSTRVTLLASDGRMLGSAAEPPPSRRCGAGEAVVAGAELWEQVVRLIRGLDALAGGDVVGIGVAAQLGVALVDAGGCAVDDVLLWPDGRARREAEELVARMGTVSERIGRPISAELPACKMLWWARNRPGAVDSARWVLSLKDFLVMQLTRRAVSDETHASYTGWFDVAARAYSDELVARSGVDARLLPPVLGATESAGTVHPDVAAQLGLPATAEVAVGAPDGTAGALGAGAVCPGSTVDVAGTTDVLLSVVGEPCLHPMQRAALNAYALPGCWVLGGPTGMTGGAVEWVARLVGFPSASTAFERIGAAAMALPPGAGGVSFDPALSGSRFPAWEGAQRGMLAGLERHHAVPHLIRAAHEGAAFVVLEGIDVIRAAGAVVDEVMIVGGVARRPELVQLRSDLWGLPLRVGLVQEATTVGGAILAGMASGAFHDAGAAVQALVRPGQRVVPGRIDRDEIARARSRWRATARAARSLHDSREF